MYDPYGVNKPMFIYFYNNTTHTGLENQLNIKIDF